MIKYANIAIIASFFGLWINSYFPNELEIIIGFVLILSFGILHGANDIALILNVNSSKKTANFYKILIYYVFIVLGGALLFTILPWLALTLFIVCSGYHFGEQQWHLKLNTLSSTPLRSLFQMIYGLLLLFILFVFHSIEVQKIILAITSISIPEQCYLLILEVLLPSYFLLSLYLYFTYEPFKKVVFTELFYLILYTVLFKVSTLIWGFALYFILWHSIPSMIDQIKFLYGTLSLRHFKAYFKTAFPYWITALLGILLLYLIFRNEKIFNALFFSFLASITFPHVVVIQRMFGKNKP
ncbi:MAG: hypothetical protein RL427_279 [Bacteroidota bacterium]